MTRGLVKHKLHRSVRWVKHLGKARIPGHCLICDADVNLWYPHPQAKTLRSAFMAELESIGSDLSIYLCPNCGCNDRDRHVWGYMQSIGVLKTVIPSGRILHLAPESAVSAKLAALSQGLYIKGDLYPQPGHMRINLERLPFLEASFDFILCNHVLEHVGNFDAALSELHRCLSYGGVLIAQTPFSPVLKRTFEANKPMSSSFCINYFGQQDHVRLFGSDIGSWFYSAGFCGGVLDNALFFNESDTGYFGFNAREPLFIFGRSLEVIRNLLSSSGIDADSVL